MAGSAHRKVVTVLFCDVVGSTALGELVDPEALQALLARYFERMSRIVESHGGSVEKFIGDAVMAVFGVPVAHEDDALRACRAAVEMRDALPELDLEGRIGVNTGEVLTGTEERLATGDAVNVAARLEQAAEPGEVLIGTETLGLLGGAVEVGDERQLELKGKSEPVFAYPLHAVREVAERSHVSRFVGRERELHQLADAWDGALAGRRCELITVVGDPGVGKSRLVAEALAQIDARVVRGRCLPYGEGITYWPVVEVVKQLDALPSDEHAATAIRSLLGDSDTVTGADEIAWAFRKLLEEKTPLVVCFDDIHWGETTFLDLVESIALLSAGVPLLLVCMARRELLDRRARWPTPLQLEPLPLPDAEAIIGDQVPAQVRERILRASGGNPLFLTEMVAFSESEAGEIEVPPTLRALLAARLDQLDEPERKVLERGAVEGELFHRGSVQALAPEETELTPRLAALVRHDLVRPDRPQLPHEDAYRFRHLLIRDAAYDALPKAIRAELHRRFARWLEGRGLEALELDEILGYHLEQAAQYLAELGRPDAEVGLDAGEHLARAGRRALFRGDLTAASTLLARALKLTRPVRLDMHLETSLAWGLGQTDVSRAVEVAEAAADRAEAEGDEAMASLGRTVAANMRLFRADCTSDELEQLAQEALPLLEAIGDDEGLSLVWLAMADVASLRAQMAAGALATEQALLHGRRAGHPRRTAAAIGVELALGPLPASEALEKLDSLLPAQPYPFDLLLRAVITAMLGQVEEAWSVALAANLRTRELGRQDGDTWLAEIALIADDQASAEIHLKAACHEFETSGATSFLSTYAPRLGRVLCARGRADEAEPLIRLGRELGDPEDPWTQAAWRQTEALLQSAHGHHAEAEQLAREGVDWIARSDSLIRQGEALDDLAGVLEAAGRPEESAAALHQALDRYERKQIIPLVHRTRQRLAALQKAPPGQSHDVAVP